MPKPTKEEQADRDRREMGRWEAMRDRGAEIMRESARQEGQAAKPDRDRQREEGVPTRRA